MKSKKMIGLIAVLMVVSLILAACAAKTATPTEVEVPEPSNPGAPGPAVNLTGDVTAGEVVFKASCVTCHGEEGKGGVANPGGTEDVPALNPIDPGLITKDAKTNTTNIDLFLEHGSKPEGDNPAKVMTAFGDQKTLTAQQIADVIAYVLSLNK